MSTWKELKDNPRLKDIYEARIKIIKLIREFFWSKDFIETDTPIAVRLASQEPYLNPLPVIFHDPNGREERFYLRTSPEYALKKLLAAGFSKIFEIAKVFRDFEEFGQTHNTEFTMIEWYRAPGNLMEIMDDTEELFKYVAERLSQRQTSPSIPPLKGEGTLPLSLPPLLGEGQGVGSMSGILSYRDRKVDITQKWERLTMKEVWHKYAGINLDEYLDRESLFRLAKERGYGVSEKDAYEDLFFKIFLNEIEGHLGENVPIIVYNYPAQMCSLSKLSEKDPRYAERFELYVAGLELANAFGELTDAKEQKTRLEHDKNLRAKLGKETWPVDGDFINALGGLPDIARRATAGIALGVDRMVMLFTEARDINEVIFQSVKDQI